MIGLVMALLACAAQAGGDDVAKDEGTSACGDVTVGGSAVLHLRYGADGTDCADNVPYDATTAASCCPDGFAFAGWGLEGTGTPTGVSYNAVCVQQ